MKSHLSENVDLLGLGLSLRSCLVLRHFSGIL
jgi:hypothetical protein